MKAIRVALLILSFFSQLLTAKTIECRPYENERMGIYIEVDESKMIDPSGYVYKKIGTNDGVDLYRGFDKKNGFYVVFMIKKESTGNIYGVQAFEAAFKIDQPNGAISKVMCFDAKKVKEFRKNNQK